MKRMSIGLAAILALLVAAGTAFAAIDTYSGGYKFNGKSGTKSKPAPLSFSQDFSLKAVTAGSLTGVLTDIKTSISGVKVDTKGFPTCTAADINKVSKDTGCPKQALVAKGAITAQLGTAMKFAPQNLNCDPTLDVWNAGPGKLTFFFVTTSSHECLNGSITTGQTPAFPATYKNSGSGITVEIPVPNNVTHIGPYLASLNSEKLNWKSMTYKGTTSIASTGCKGKRKWSYTFKASAPGGLNETKTIMGTSACG